MKINPYATLKNDFSQWIGDTICRKRTLMWTYSEKSLNNDVWPLGGLTQRVRAAQQLGHTVELVATDAGLEVWYVAPMPSKPWWY